MGLTRPRLPAYVAHQEHAGRQREGDRQPQESTWKPSTADGSPAFGRVSRDNGDNGKVNAIPIPTTLAAMLAVLLALPATAAGQPRPKATVRDQGPQLAITRDQESAQGANFAVPQGKGGGVLPTIALVECMADENTRPAGQYCQAAYFCTGGEGGKGRLWQGLSSHNSSALTLVPSQTDCVLKVGDPARVRFLNLADFAEYATSCGESDDCAEPYITSEILAGLNNLTKILAVNPSKPTAGNRGRAKDQDDGPSACEVTISQLNVN